MVLLKICLLGSFQLWLGGKPVRASNPIKSVHCCLTWRSRKIAHTPAIQLPDCYGLNTPESSAIGNLRWALSSLRITIKDHSPVGESAIPPHLLVYRESLQFNNASDYWLDVSAFKEISGQWSFSTQPVEPST